MKNGNIECYEFPLNENIISRVGDYILDNFSVESMDKACIIFSGKRPELFLKKYLAEKIKHSFVPPKIFSIEEFIAYVVSKYKDVVYINDIDAVYLLYNIVKKKRCLSKQVTRSFYTFLSWGYEIYGFIEEITLEKVSLKDLKKISFDFTTDDKTMPSLFGLIDSIAEIYTSFYSQLEEKNLYTRAMVYKFASEYVKDKQIEEFDKIIFVTPFYLHKSELDLISNLKENNSIVIFLQTDNDTDWKSLERLKKCLGIEKCLKTVNFVKEDKPANIFFYSAFDKESEVNFVHTILKNLNEKDIDKTVIVLPEQDTSVELLSAIPQKVKEFNLVCGYPLRRSSIYCLLDSVFTAQLNKKNGKYYAQDYIAVITNPLVKNLKLGLPEGVVALIVETIETVLYGKIEDKKISKAIFINLKDIENNNTIYSHLETLLKEHTVPIKDIIETVRKLHTILFYQWETIETFSSLCSAVKSLLDVIFESGSMEEYFFNLRVFDKLYNTIDMFKHTMFSTKKFPAKEIFKIFISEIEKFRIPLTGSPLKGLQILGFYETRNLNFDNLIILDVNESILPFLKTKPVLIPREVMINLGIDRIEIEEEIQRYHFKRLISSSKNVYIIYVETEQTERSRFVEELIWQEEKKNKRLGVSSLVYGTFKVNLQPKKKEVVKTQDVIEKLKSMYYSVSAVDLYLRCPLKFYFGYVLSLEETDIFIDEPEGKDIGNVLHTMLEQAFKPYLGKKPVIDTDFCQKFFSLFNELFNKELEHRYKAESFLVRKVMEFHLSKFISYEQTRIEKDQVEEILLLEEKLYDKYTLNNGQQINFVCKIDRVDKLANGTLLVIDYKTGSIDKMKINKDLTDLELNRDSIKKKIKSFQLPMYVHIISNKYKTETNAMFYSIKEPEEIELLFSDNAKMAKDQIISQVNLALNYILNEILDPQIPFYEDSSDPYQCESCEYINLCR